MGAEHKKMPDHQPKKLTKVQKEWIHQLDQVIAEHDQKLLKYFDDRMLNLVAQFRALAIAAGITPEAFWKEFIDEKAQEQFYVRLHAQEDLHNLKVNELQSKNQQIAEAFGENPK